MKIKIQFFPSNNFEVPFIICVPSTIKEFKQLKNYLFEAFKLKQISCYLENFEILLDDCKIPDFQQIIGFATQSDIFKLNIVSHSSNHLLSKKIFQWKVQHNICSDQMFGFSLMQDELSNSEINQKLDEIVPKKIENEKDISAMLKIESKWQWENATSCETYDSLLDQVHKKVKLNEEQNSLKINSSFVKISENTDNEINPLSYSSQILRPQSQICQPIQSRPIIDQPSRSIAQPSRLIASPSRQIASPSRLIASPSRQIASPPRLIASPSRYIASQYQEPIESRIIAQSGCPSIYSPSKSRYQSQVIQQQQLPQSSYFIENVPERNPNVPDYATYLTQSPRGSRHIEQPVNEPPIFVPQLPQQSSITPGEPVRFDHYSTVGEAPPRFMPSGSPDRTIKARLLQSKPYQQQYY